MMYSEVLVRLPKKNLKSPTLGAKIGCNEGETCEVLLKAFRNPHILCIDPWLAYDGNDYFNQDKTAGEAYHKFQPVIGQSPFQYTVYRMLSEKGAYSCPDGIPDFVSPSMGRHIGSDILHGLPKLHPGSIRSGHDLGHQSCHVRMKEVVIDILGADMLKRTTHNLWWVCV